MSQPESLSDDRINNFNILRMLAAFLVIAGHGYILCGYPAPTFCNQEINSIGLFILFTLGGYLITLSWRKDPHVHRYLLKRIMRIWPPLFVLVIVTVAIFGPLLTNSTIDAYKNGATRYLLNLIFYPIFDLPGVFLNNPLPIAVNGSLWTLPFEMVFYILIPIIVTAMDSSGKDKLPDIFIVSLIVVTIIASYWSLIDGFTLTFLGSDWVACFRLFPFYLMGVLFTRDWAKKKLSLPISIILIFVLLGLNVRYDVSNAILMIALPYIVFSFAFAPSKLNQFGKKYEISYGIYLYGYLISQTIVYCFTLSGIAIIPLVIVLLSFFFAVLFGFFSFFVAEKPSKQITNYLLKRTKKST